MLQNTNINLDKLYDEVLKFYGYPPRVNEVSSSISKTKEEKIQQTDSNFFEN